MEAGVVQIAADEDFDKLWELVSSDHLWTLEYEQNQVYVWTKHSNTSNLKMVKVKAVYEDTEMQTLFDVLMDGDYRHTWDSHMIESYSIGYLNPNNDIGYYAMSCPPPIQNRDFMLQRSWLATQQRISIYNHSIHHKDHPPKKYYVRGISHLTGYVIEPLPGQNKGCSLHYISLTDPRGAIPAWAINKSTQFFAPKMIKTLSKACQGYSKWKSDNHPGYKPWIYPEQITLPKINIQQCISNGGSSWVDCTSQHKTLQSEVKRLTNCPAE